MWYSSNQILDCHVPPGSVRVKSVALAQTPASFAALNPEPFFNESVIRFEALLKKRFHKPFLIKPVVWFLKNFAEKESIIIFMMMMMMVWWLPLCIGGTLLRAYNPPAP